MRLTFLNPSFFPEVPNIGLAYLMAIADKKHKVSLLDLGFQHKKYREYVIRGIDEQKPDVVGISALISNFPVAIDVARLIKARRPSTRIILGGVHCTLEPEMSIAESAVDAICIGPGEETLMEYLDSLEHSRQPQIDGIWYKDPQGMIVKNKPRPFKDNLDTLPFPNWDYWDIERYSSMGDYYAHSLIHLHSRGCPYQCAFCTNPAIAKAVPGPYYRLRSPHNVVEEIECNYAKYGNEVFKNIYFIDDIFGLDHRWLQEFCSLFIQAGLHKKLTWTCQTRADVISPAWAESARRAGCNMVILGIESGNEELRIKSLGKTITDEQVEQSIACLKNNNIGLRFQMVMGMPGETLETSLQSLSLIRKHQPDYFDFTFYQPFPKTELTKKMGYDEKKLYSIFFTDSKGNPFRINHDIPGGLKKGTLKLMVRLTHLYKTYSFFKTGIRLNGFYFLIKVTRFIFFPGKLRRLPLMHPFILRELFTKTVFACYQRK